MKNLIWIYLLLIIMLSCKRKSYEISVQSDLVETFENGSVKLKENIPDGKYFVTISDLCNNKDTLLIAKMKSGLKEGKWIYYTRLHFFDSCDFEIELEEIDFYENGHLLSSEEYIGTGIMTTIYQPNQKKHNEDKIVIDHRYEDGTRHIDSFRNENHTSSFDFGKDGKLETKTESISDTFFVQQYFPNGKINNEYKLIQVFLDNQASAVFDGKAITWNEKGEVIKIVNYEMGKIIQK